MSAVRMSGTFSKKYPVRGCPFTRTPNSRSRSTHFQTVDLDTPISRATRAPLTTIVAFSASNVTNDAICRSVNPGSVSVVGFFVAFLVSDRPDVGGSVNQFVGSLRLPHALHK